MDQPIEQWESEGGSPVEVAPAAQCPMRRNGLALAAVACIAAGILLRLRRG